MGAISNDWLEPLSAEFKKPYYKKLYETEGCLSRRQRYFQCV